MHRVTSLFLCDTYYFVHHFLKIKIKNCFFCSVHHSPSIKWTVYVISLTGSVFVFYLPLTQIISSIGFFHWSFSLITQKMKCQLMGVQTLLEKGATIKFSQTISLFSLAIYFPDFSNITKRSTKSLRDVMTTKNLLCTL